MGGVRSGVAGRISRSREGRRIPRREVGRISRRGEMGRGVRREVGGVGCGVVRGVSGVMGRRVRRKVGGVSGKVSRGVWGRERRVGGGGEVNRELFSGVVGGRTDVKALSLPNDSSWGPFSFQAIKNRRRRRVPCRKSQTNRSPRRRSKRGGVRGGERMKGGGKLELGEDVGKDFITIFFYNLQNNFFRPFFGG